ncbi:MAG: S66 peptidase family protein [Candidatus Methanodesulfokora sp.]
MEIVRPPALSPGSTIAVVSPSSPADPKSLARGVGYLRKKGYKVILGDVTKSVRMHGYLAAPDEMRAAELSWAFRNEEVKAIIAAGGGAGSIRILPYVDFDIIRSNPKIFIGFSDITTLLVAIHEITGLVTIHGPVVKDFNPHNKEAMISAEWLFNLISSKDPVGDVVYDESIMLPRVVISGSGEGRLIGGNLTMLAVTLGTKFGMKEQSGRILFLEDVGMEPYLIDNFLGKLWLSGVLRKDLSGVIIGEFTEIIVPQGEYTLRPETIVASYMQKVKVPSIYGFPVGHSDFNLALPIGVKARINADELKLSILESAVD